MDLAIKEILLDRSLLIDLAKKAFDEADEDNSGEIDFEELSNLLINFSKIFNKEPTKEDIKEIMNHLDNNNNGYLDFNEFFLLIKDILEAMLEANIKDQD